MVWHGGYIGIDLNVRRRMHALLECHVADVVHRNPTVSVSVVSAGAAWLTPRHLSSARRHPAELCSLVTAPNLYVPPCLLTALPQP